jgi:uroporphyrinogen-III synthase
VAEVGFNPLRGKRVIVTRALEQSEQLVAELNARGAVPVVLPMVAFVPPDDLRPLDDAIRQLRSFDWLFLTSQNSLRALRERCESLKLDLREVFSGVKLAVVGPATAEAVEREGLRVAHVASKHQGSTLAEELTNDVRDKRVLLPRSDRANPELVELLKRFGAHVTEVCAYKTIRPEGGADTAAKIAQADAVLFFSPSAVHHLRESLGHQAFLDLSRRSVFVAIGPVTGEALRVMNAATVVVARDASVDAAMETLGDYFVQASAGNGPDAQPGMAVPRFKE